MLLTCMKEIPSYNTLVFFRSVGTFFCWDSTIKTESGWQCWYWDFCFQGVLCTEWSLLFKGFYFTCAETGAFHQSVFLLPFSFPVPDNVGWCRAPWKEGKQAAFCVFSLAMRPHHFLTSNRKSLPLGGPNWHVCGRGPVPLPVCPWLVRSEFGSLAQKRPLRYPTLDSACGYTNSFRCQAKHLCSCIRSESGYDRIEVTAEAAFVKWNLASRQKSLFNFVQMAATATELQLREVSTLQYSDLNTKNY